MTESEQPATPQDSDAGEQLVITSPDESSTPKDFLLWAGVIVLAVLTVYSPALYGEFLWDDDRHVEYNRNLRDAQGLANIWTKFGLRNGGTPQYYPFAHTTYWIEYQLIGAQPGEISTTIFHVTNAVLHAGAAILLWFVLRQLGLPGAWVGAAIFALHPVNAESVAWISERKNVLAAAFFFGAILAYLRSNLWHGFSTRSSYEQGLKTRATGEAPDQMYWLSLGLFVLGLLSKTIVCSMPAVVLVLAWWKRGTITRRDILWTLPFFIIALPMALLTSWLERTEVGASGADWALSVSQRVIIAGRAVWFYAAKVVWPAKLTFIYPKWNVDPSNAAQWLYPIGVVAVLAALFLLRKRIGRGPLAAALIFVGVLVPALGFFNVYPMRYSYVADHFQYLAAPALIALIVVLIARALAGIEVKALPYGLGGVVLIVLAVLTLLRSRVYASQVTLWADTERKNPNSFMVQNNLGNALYLHAAQLPPDRADEVPKLLEDAVAHLHKATELKSDHDRAYQAWGQALLLQGKPAEAVEKFDRALAIDSTNVDRWLGRGTALERSNRPDEAAESYRRGVAEANARRGFWPRLTVATLHHRLSAIAQGKGDLETARRELEQAIVVDPRIAQFQIDYARLLAKMGERVKAAEALGKAIQLDPMALDAHLELIQLRLDVNNLRGAEAAWRLAGEIARRNPQAVTPAQAQRMIALFQRWQAATRPSTTRTTTQSTTTRGTSEVFSAPTTQPTR